MTLESSDWCIPSSASNIPSMSEAPEVIYCNDPETGAWNEPGTNKTVKATTSNVNTNYNTSYSDVRTEKTPTTLVDSNSNPIKVYEYVDAQHIAVTSDNSWVEGKAYFIGVFKGK